MSLLKLEKETTAWNDLKVGREDAELFRIIEKWDHEHTNGLVIVEDYWLPMIAIRKNHKLTVKKQKKIFFVVSGMELSNPDLCTLRDLDLQKYNAVLFIRKNNGNFSIPDWLIRQRGKLIPSRNKQFTILEIRNE